MRSKNKKRRQAGHFFLRQVKAGHSACGRIPYNSLCRGCTHRCKQSRRAAAIRCPRCNAKRRNKEGGDNGR